MKIVSIESTREVNIPQPNWVPGLTRQGFGGESDEGVIGEFELLKAAFVNGRNTLLWGNSWCRSLCVVPSDGHRSLCLLNRSRRFSTFAGPPIGKQTH